MEAEAVDGRLEESEADEKLTAVPSLPAIKFCIFSLSVIFSLLHKRKLMFQLKFMSKSYMRFEI